MMLINPIATVQSCYTQKFATPRQSGLVETAWARLQFNNTPFMHQALEGIEDFSHLWIIFGFHLNTSEAKPKIRTPKIVGKASLYATRSPHRPNNLGLSLVKLDTIEIVPNYIFLHVSGHDLVDGTPVYDIKPYIPDYDCPKFEVRFGSHSARLQAINVINWSCSTGDLNFEEKKLIEQTLCLDPRPRHIKTNDIFKASIAGINIEFTIVQDQLNIHQINRERRHGIK
jgi:tRNA-Thr(GGU) m(6)t(6)A37 methyltransferase TsaA